MTETCLTQPQLKPLLTVEQQIAHMKAKGITFDLCGEDEAAVYLRDANNYLRAASYRKLYPRRIGGEHDREYIGLDFQDLVELSAIDRRLREEVLSIVVDVEHFAKMRLLSRCEAEGEDGYSIVANYLASVSLGYRSRIEGSLERRAAPGASHDEYSGDLILRYRETGYPIWVLLEVVEFGVLVDLWRFCADRWLDSRMRDEHFVLKSVKAVRNAVAHNSLVVNGFGTGAARTGFQPSRLISVSLNACGVKNTKSRRAKLSNLRMAQLAATLWSLDEFCARPSTRRRHAARLAEVRKYAEGCGVLDRCGDGTASFFSFLWELVDIWAPESA